MRDGLLKAYELLAYGAPDPDLTNSVSGQAWMKECDEWLDKFPPSKLPKQDEPPAEHPDTIRLEWLLKNISGAEWRRLKITYGDGMNRTALNDAMAQSSPNRQAEHGRS
jgi:hypothetical protein